MSFCPPRDSEEKQREMTHRDIRVFLLPSVRGSKRHVGPRITTIYGPKNTHEVYLLFVAWLLHTSHGEKCVGDGSEAGNRAWHLSNMPFSSQQEGPCLGSHNWRVLLALFLLERPLLTRREILEVNGMSPSSAFDPCSRPYPRDLGVPSPNSFEHIPRTA